MTVDARLFLLQASAYIAVVTGKTFLVVQCNVDISLVLSLIHI